MSRSLGATPFTRRDPIEIVPAEISSSPAIMRNRVDLPQPEGPTSTQNSPSSTATSTPCRISVEPKLLRTSERVTDAMRVLDLRVSSLWGILKGRGQVIAAPPGTVKRFRARYDACGEGACGNEENPDHRGRGGRGRPPAPRARRALRPAALRHTSGRGARGGRGIHPRRLRQPARHAARHQGRRRGGAPRRILRRRFLGNDPAREHRRRLQRVRGGASQRRSPHGVRDQQSRGRVLRPRRDHRSPRLSQARQPLRRVQGVRRSARQPLRAQVRHGSRVRAHRQRQSASHGQAAPVDLAVAARPRAARVDRDRQAGDPLRDRLRRLRQPPQLVRQCERRAPGLQTAGRQRGLGGGNPEQHDTRRRSAHGEIPGRDFRARRGRRRPDAREGPGAGPAEKGEEEKMSALAARFAAERASFPGPVLVTGAAGCIGSWVLALLVRAGVAACAFDLSEDKRRPRLLMSEDELKKIQWRLGDISDGSTVMRVLEEVRPCAVIHLAALQVPFCKADPIAGAKVNVVGTVNIFEAARRLEIKRLAYASSIAAYGAMDDGHGAMHTLYGAYKYCDEQIAKVYSQDWNVASVGIRPGVVYGVGRDQGLTSKTTFAILAAAAGKAYEVPFSGGVSWLYAGEAASAFIHAVSRERKGAPVFDMNGVYAPVEEGLSILRQLAPSAAITSSGQPLAFPMHLPDEPLRAHLGDYGNMPLDEGIRETYETFRSLIGRGMLALPAAA